MTAKRHEVYSLQLMLGLCFRNRGEWEAVEVVKEPRARHLISSAVQVMATERIQRLQVSGRDLWNVTWGVPSSPWS